VIALLPSLFASAADARPSGSAMDAVITEVARRLGSTPASSIVVAAPLASDQPAPKGEQLALRMAALVAGKIGANAHAYPHTAALASARAVAGRASALLYLETEIVRGDLRATIDVYSSMANAWDRIRNPLPSPAGHSFSSAKIDSEVRTFLTPLVLEQASVHKAHHELGEVLAAACGDLDGDGGDELALVTRTNVAMGRVVGDKFVAERTASWSALSPALPVAMREPLATAAVATDAIYAGLTDRGGVSLTPDFAGHAPLRGLPASDGDDGIVCLTAEPSAGAFDGAPTGCAGGRQDGPKMALPAPRYDAFAASSVADSAGGVRMVVAVREPSGKLRLKSADATRTPAGDYGAELAVADLDQDGAPEIVTTVDGPDDAISVSSWTSASADPILRWHIAAPAGVRALAVCPPERQGQPVLVAVVGDEIWLVRAALQGSPIEAAGRPAAAAGAR
jgi:hypothetical protein